MSTVSEVDEILFPQPYWRGGDLPYRGISGKDWPYREVCCTPLMSEAISFGAVAPGRPERGSLARHTPSQPGAAAPSAGRLACPPHRALALRSASRSARRGRPSPATPRSFSVTSRKVAFRCFYPKRIPIGPRPAPCLALNRHFIEA